MIKFNFRGREVTVDDACIARAKEANCDPIEHRLWEAGVMRDLAKQVAEENKNKSKTNG